MASEESDPSRSFDHIWNAYLTTGSLPDSVLYPWYRSKRFVSLYRHLPANPRCRICHLPFKGLGGALARHLFGVAPSRMNPQLCNSCEQFADKFHGGTEIELTVLFADVRGSTTLAEGMKPSDFSRLIDRFYSAATKVLFNANAMVEKFVGDAVTGFFTPGMAGPDHAQRAIQAAKAILRETGHHQAGGPWIPVGIGIHTGIAYVGAVNTDSGVSDIAVLGDTPNIGARLSSLAAAGEIHVSCAAAQAAHLDSAGVEIRRPVLKGRSEPVEVWVLPQG